MSNKKQTLLKDTGMTKTKNTVLCSTPERRSESSSRDSDSLCGSEAASPVPFLCTQDGTEGETDVIWNYYTPKSGQSYSSRMRKSTPVSRNMKIAAQEKVLEKPLIKRKPAKSSDKNKILYQELFELNQNLRKNAKSKCKTEKQQSGSEEDIFSDSSDHSPKTGRKTSSRCLRKNLLNLKFAKPEAETETALESDDSMNECLLKASQVVEDNILKWQPMQPVICYESNGNHNLNMVTASLNLNNSIDTILSNMKSPNINNIKNNDTPCLNNDSFDTFVGNLNDSALEKLTQMHVKNETVTKKREADDDTDWMVKELIIHNGSPSSKTVFSRYNSMPESPTPSKITRPSSSGMVFGRYNSMPFFDNNASKSRVPGDSPVRCSPDEIKRKHQQARDKLLAKRRFLPFTSSQQTQFINMQSQQKATSKRCLFQPRTCSMSNKFNNSDPISSDNNNSSQSSNTIQNSTNMKLLIEKKRQEALIKLRRRQPQNKLL